MADFGINIAASVAVGIANNILECARVRALAQYCKDTAATYKDMFDYAFGDGTETHKQVFDRVFKLQVQFIGLFKAIEIILKQYAQFNYWDRFTHKRRMQADLASFERQIVQQSTVEMAQLNDAQADATSMNNAAGTLRLHKTQGTDPAPTAEGDIPRSSTGQIVEQLRINEPGVQEDPLVTKAREELLKALSEYEGEYPPLGIDSSELTMTYGKPVSSGQNSDVYRGFRENRMVAIKRLKIKEIYQITRVLDRIDREAKIWGKLKHTNIIPFLGCCRPRDELPFLVSPWMENRDARNYRHAHPEADILKMIFVQLMGVASGLEYLHTFEPAPVVHGSLRGSHILLDDDLNASLSDFGISHLLTDAYTGSRPPKQAWSAPEVLRATTAPTPESDIYSFASVAYELIAAADPFDHIAYRDANWLRKKICDGETPGFPTKRFRELPNENCRMWKDVEAYASLLEV
ncbi:kinase-like domain-containing protein [Lyophyllum atratum]|nr:kinase-like domain-containing protein [Lyophyllum atratum]